MHNPWIVFVANQSINGPSQSLGHEQFFEMKGCQSDELIFHVWSRTSAPEVLFGIQQRWVSVYFDLLNA